MGNATSRINIAVLVHYRVCLGNHCRQRPTGPWV